MYSLYHFLKSKVSQHSQCSENIFEKIKNIF